MKVIPSCISSFDLFERNGWQYDGIKTTSGGHEADYYSLDITIEYTTTVTAEFIKDWKGFPICNSFGIVALTATYEYKPADNVIIPIIYEKLIKGYTEKQWGRCCTELSADIIKRLPVRFTFDNNYFNDKYQGIPVGGYNKLIDGLLDGVECVTDTDFFKSKYRDWKKYADKLVYTGPIDEYFDFVYGKLDWRTVSFKTRVERVSNYQGNAVVNYTSHDKPYTRVIEHKHFEMFGQEVYDSPNTVVSEEYSTEYKDGMEPYYPVNDVRNNELAEKYRSLAEDEKNVIFGGRLGQYKYYDMAPVIEQVLNMEID